MENERCSLKTLNLRCCSFTSKGAFKIFSCIRKQKRLTTLDVSNNKIGPNKPAMVALKEALRGNLRLTHLIMDNTEICDVGGVCLGEILGKA
jgi:Ran GTPase-activating protein (RanGAP) involved in mRNA processing and transport